MLKLWQMIVDAGQTWNDNAMGGWFSFEGFSDVVNADGNCSELNGKSLVRMSNGNDFTCMIARAYITPKCGGTLWEMVICDDYNWSWLGEPGPAQIDLMQTITHEFGHALGLGHPSDGEAAVMAPTSNSNGSLRQRELYRYDVQCIADLSKSTSKTKIRNSLIYVLKQLSDGQFVEEFVIPHGARKGSVHRRPPGTSPATLHGAFFTLENGDVKHRVARGSGLQILGGTRSAFSYATIPITATVFDIINAVYTIVGHSSQWTWNSRTELRAHVYFNGITSPPATAPFGAFGGDRAGVVASADRPSITYDNASEMTVMAWTNQARSDNDREGEIFIGLKGIPNAGHPALIGRIWGTGEKSAAGPSVACQNHKAYQGFDCMLAYVPRDAPHPGLNLRYFSIEPQEEKPVWSPTTTVVPAMYVVGSPAIWYHQATEEWYIAYVSGAESRAVHIERSQDGGRTWETSQELGKTITSPIMNDAFSAMSERRLSISR